MKPSRIWIGCGGVDGRGAPAHLLFGSDTVRRPALVQDCPAEGPSMDAAVIVQPGLDRAKRGKQRRREARLGQGYDDRCSSHSEYTVKEGRRQPILADAQERRRYSQ